MLSGIKWVTTLSTRVAEKRMANILAAASMASEIVSPPLSPEPRRPKARIAVAEQAKSTLSYGLRPSWVTSIASVSIPKQNTSIASASEVSDSTADNSNSVQRDSSIMTQPDGTLFYPLRFCCDVICGFNFLLCFQ